MLVVFNIILIALVGLIAYWWANQGVFSALLHLLCVIVAGTIAFAFWEPFTTSVLLKGKFQPYAWGVGLVLLFGVSMVVLRVILDRLAPANVRTPQWANLTFGGLAGLASGVLTIGIFLIGAGHVQSIDKIMGFRGAYFTGRPGEIASSQKLWVPFHSITSQFYSTVSVGSMRPLGNTPMKQYAPRLDEQLSLVRNNYSGGRGQISLVPDQAEVKALYEEDAGGTTRYYVEVEFKEGARDFNEQLTISAAQLRLIGVPTSTHAEAPVLYPSTYRQFSGVHRFDHMTHYVVSQPGAQSASPVIGFDAPADFVPRFVQIKGTRYALPAPSPLPPFLATMFASARTGGASTEVAPPGGSIDDAIIVSNSIRPISVSKNMVPAGMSLTGDFLSDGTGEFTRGRTSGSRALRVKGIYEPDGTRCVQVDISRGSSADLFRFDQQVTETDEIKLIDNRGTEYLAIGYMYASPDGTIIKLVPSQLIHSLADLPVIPTSGNHNVKLLFYVTEGVTVTGLRIGNIGVGTASVLIPASPGG